MFVALVGDGPTYLQLYRGLRDAIVTGRLAAGTSLPSTRVLADELELSRNTILRAYEQLIAEGFATARHGGGTFVTAEAGGQPAVERAEAPSIAIGPGGRRIAVAMASNPFVALAGLAPVPYDFLFGVPDASLFPIQEWRRTMSRCIDRASKRTLGYDQPTGVTRLREQVAAHLVKHRGVRCHPAEIVIVNGAQQAFDLLARVLLEPGDHVLVEDPGYPAVRAILRAAGANLVMGPVDGEGIDLAGAGEDRDRCKMAFVTPSHQFPSGAVMSAPRRRVLLDWAVRTGAVIVEDDYDGDFRHTGRPIQALQGLDTAGRVVHVGTFSKSLFPSLRLGYVVVPESLVQPLAAAKWIADWSSPVLLQHALADFIEAGHFARHLKKSGGVYARRRDALLAAIGRELGADGEVSGGDAGMHVVLWLPRLDPDELLPVIARARALGVGVYPIGAFCEAPSARAGVVLGYSGLAEPQIAEGMALFARALRG